MRIFIAGVIVMLAVIFAAAGFAASPRSPNPEKPVIEAQKKAAGRIRTLSNDTVLGGRPVMPAQYRVTEPAGIRAEKVAGNLSIPRDWPGIRKPGTCMFLNTALQENLDWAETTRSIGSKKAEITAGLWLLEPRASKI